VIIRLFFSVLIRYSFFFSLVELTKVFLHDFKKLFIFRKKRKKERKVTVQINEIGRNETKPNETKRNQTKRSETKPSETKPNETNNEQ